MPTMTTITENGKTLWKYTETSIDQFSTITLDTGGKFVDKDIRVQIDAVSGSASVTGNQTITKNPTITWDGTNKKIKATYDGSGIITGTVGTEGWISSIASSTVTTNGTTSIDPTILQNNLTAGNIKKGVSIFGITGSFIGDSDNPGTITSGSATISSVSYTYDSTNTNFKIAGSATIGAPTVRTAGYVSSSVGTKNTNTATVAATVAKIALGTTKTSGNLTVAPTLTRTAKPAGDKWIDAASGAATTTKPTTAVPYVQIDAAAATNTLKVKPTVSNAGYGDTTNYGYTEYSASVGAAKATTRYIPIKTGSATTPTNSTALASTSTSLDGSTLTVEASITPTVSAGWVSSGTAGTVKISGTVPSGTISTGETSNGTGWTTNTTAVVPANGYLYIGAGYYPNTQISLATLIPDDADYTNAGTGEMRANYEAYDTNGNKLIGTIPNYTPSTTYFTTTNTGYGVITQKSYVNTTANYYIKKATPAFDGGALNNKAASITSINATIVPSTESTASGIALQAKGTAGRDAVLYNGKVSGWVEAADNASASAAVASSTWNGTNYYLTALTIEADKTLNSITINTKGTGTAAGKITTVTNNGTIGTLSGTGTISTLSGSQTISSLTGSITITAATDADTATAASNAKVTALGQVVIQDGTWKATTHNVSTSAQTAYGKVTTTALYTSGISAANIKYNQVVKVGDTNSNTRIHNVRGTFTAANTVSSGQTAASATQMLSGYSAWVNGAEVKGSIATYAGTYTVATV